MTIILFLIILAVLIFVHELGHFVSAKLFGIRVDEFAIGFPPKIFGWQRGETKYSLNLIPFGGYVKIFGENPDENSISGFDSARSFINAKKWKQIIVLISGILMNIIFAWILISISFNIGMPTSIDEDYKEKAQNISVMITSVMKDSPSDKAGLKPGDSIIGLESGQVNIKSPSISEIQKIIADSKGNITVQYKRKEIESVAKVYPESGVIEGKVAIGISMSLVGIVRLGFFESFIEGAKLTYIETKNIAIGLYSFISKSFKGQGDFLANISGPVGIASMVGEASEFGSAYLFGLIALISLNLAVLNFIPFPALDGGRILFVLIELIIRKKIKPAIVNWTNIFGFFILIALMFFVTYKDIMRFF